MTTSANRRYWILIATIVTAGAGMVWWRHTRPAAVEYRPGSLGHSGLPDQIEFQLVVIGSTTCHGADSPAFQAAIRRLQERVRAEGKGDSVAVTLIGVGLDWVPDDADRFLRRFGAFDMKLIGGNWLNEGAVKYVWRDLPGEPVIPQVLLVQRHVELGGRIVVDQERVVWRLLGADVVEARSADAAPLLPKVQRTAAASKGVS
jgi:hypothetical protein